MAVTEGKPGESRAVRAIGTISRSVLRRAKHAHYARAICGALGVFALTIACALDRGSRLGDLELLLLAALLSIATFACWVRSEKIESRAVLERIDERLHLSGAFLSAHESCANSPGAPLAQLGAAKLLQRVRPNQALEAAVPHTLGFLVLPLLGLLALVQTVQVRDARQSKAGRMTVDLGTVADHLGDIERMNRAALSEMQRRELAEIQRAAEAAAKSAADQYLDQTPETGPSEEGREGDFREQFRSVADDIEKLASEAQPGSVFAEQLADAAAEAEAFAMESGPQDASLTEAESGDGRSAGSEEGTGSGDSSIDVASDGGSGPAGAGPAAVDLAATDLDPDAPELAEPSGAQGTDAVATEGMTAVASGEIAQGTTPRPMTGEGDSKVGVLRRGDRVDEPSIDETGGLAADAAPTNTVPDEAEELLDRSRWWPERDDAIVRAWLAKRAPK